MRIQLVLYVTLLSVSSVSYGQNYIGSPSLAYIAPPATPTPPAINQFYYDTSFVPSGVPVMRVTDSNFTPNPQGTCGILAGQSGAAQDDAEWFTFDYDSDMFVVRMGSPGIPMSLDYRHKTVSKLPPFTANDKKCGFMYISGNEYGIRSPWNFSGIAHGLIYGVSNIGDTSNSVRSLDLVNPTSGSSQQVVTMNATGLNCAGHLTGLTITPDDDNFSLICGGKAQDLDPYAIVWKRSTNLYQWVDGTNNLVNGHAFAPGSDPINCTFHNSGIYKSGDYVYLDVKNSCGGGMYIWNLATGQVRRNASHTGHKSTSYDRLVLAASCPGGSGMFSMWLPGDQNTCYSVLPPFNALQTHTDNHQCWRAASIIHPLAPIISTSYNQSPTLPADQGPFVRELWATYPSQNGTGRTVRIARTWSIDELVGVNPPFVYQNLTQCAPDGKTCLMTTNWGKMLGGGRTDAFLVFMPIAGNGAQHIGYGALSGVGEVQ